MDKTIKILVADDHKIIRKVRDIMYVQQEDIFTLLLLQSIDNAACQFKCIQISPLLGYILFETTLTFTFLRVFLTVKISPNLGNVAISQDGRKSQTLSILGIQVRGIQLSVNRSTGLEIAAI